MTGRISILIRTSTILAMFVLLICSTTETAFSQNQPTSRIRTIRGTVRNFTVPRKQEFAPAPEQPPEIPGFQTNQRIARQLLLDASAACVRGEQDLALRLAESACSLDAFLTPNEKKTANEMIATLRSQIARRDPEASGLRESLPENSRNTGLSTTENVSSLFAAAASRSLVTPDRRGTDNMSWEAWSPNNTRAGTPFIQDSLSLQQPAKFAHRPADTTSISSVEAVEAVEREGPAKDTKSALAVFEEFESFPADAQVLSHVQKILPAGFRVAVEPNINSDLRPQTTPEIRRQALQDSLVTAQIERDTLYSSWHPAFWAGTIGVILGSLAVMATCVLLQSQKSKPNIVRLQLDGTADLAELLNSVSQRLNRGSEDVPGPGVVVDLSDQKSPFPFRLDRTFIDQKAIDGELERKRSQEICEAMFTQNLEFQRGLSTSVSSL